MPNNPRATLWRRLAAVLYDSLLLIAYMMVITAAYVGVRVHYLGADYVTSHIGFDPLLCLLLIGLDYAFFSFFWRHGGQTLGMLAWRIKVRTLHGDPLTFTQCSARFFTALLSWLCLGAGFLWMLLPRGHRLTWHDMSSHSEVIVVPKKGC